MPVRSRTQLLAGMGALLGICTAGCQTMPVKQEAQAMRPADGSGSRAMFSFRHPRQETPAAQAASPKAEAETPVVAMMRPVAIRAVAESAPASVASTWHAVHRAPTDDTSGAEPADSMIQPVGAQVAQAPPAPLNVGAPSTLDLQPAPVVNTTLQADRLPATGDKKVSQVVHMGPPKPIHPPIHGAPVPKEFEKRALSSYVVEPPDILLIQATQAVALKTQPLEGSHLVRPDGTIGLGIYGDAFVAGKTLEQIKDGIARLLKERASKDLTVEQIKLELQVDVVAYNSKFYYVITDGGGYGQQVYRLPITGNETVLDAISQVGGLPLVASKKNIWVARATPHDCHHPKILPVDWLAITQRGCAHTNYQMFPGDRLYVQSDCLIRTDSLLAKILNPIERLLGGVLLGSGAANSAINVRVRQQ